MSRPPVGWIRQRKYRIIEGIVGVMSASDGSISFYFFDVDDNLLFLPTNLYLWNAETQTELAISSREFATIQNNLGRNGKWQPWAARPETFRDFLDQPGVPTSGQAFAATARMVLAMQSLGQFAGM
jgi:hypothetical protein